MNRKQCVVANVHYQSTRGRGAHKLKGLLRYVQYRPIQGEHTPQRDHADRWADHGLGSSFQEIAANCETAKSRYVQAFTLVINPNPDLMALVPEARRIAFVQALTEATIDNFLVERGIDSLEYSYATHRRETTDRTRPGRDNPHTHVILPGSYYSWQDGARLPLYINRSPRENHVALLHHIAEQQIDRLLQREVGLDWAQRYDLLMLEREAHALLFEMMPPRNAPDSAPNAPSPAIALDI